jgi:hypothetical protein
MKFRQLNILLLIASIVALGACDIGHSNSNNDSPRSAEKPAGAAVSQGYATTTTANLFAAGTRVAGVGTVTDLHGRFWTVPAAVNYDNNDFPFAADLYNGYGEQYADVETAVAALQPEDVVTVDTSGELITAYLFADNYFEMYINGVPVGKDAVPFTAFNSHVVQFRVERPFTIAMQLVDWEENLGLGTERNRGFSHFPGDGGMVAVVTDDTGKTIASTGREWKAQTFYVAPVADPGCVVLNGNTRDSSACSTAGSDNGREHYALHWPVDSNWMAENYDDGDWPAAVTFTNETVVVHNKPAYTTFADVFDARDDDAEFIWSSNLVLDNSVLVRYTVE